MRGERFWNRTSNATNSKSHGRIACQRVGILMGGTTIVRSESPINGRSLQVQPSQDEVRDQLGRILASPLFKNSRHYPALLRFIVEETLENRSSHLKERSLGVDVFG